MNFVICGVAVIGLSRGLRIIIAEGPGSLWGPILLAVFGIGLVGAGLFVADPILGYPLGQEGEGTLIGTIHNFSSIAVFISLPSFIFLMARRFAEYPDWKGWVFYSMLTAILFIILFISFITASALVESGKISNAPVGLLQRFTIIIGWSWITLFALTLRSKI